MIPQTFEKCKEIEEKILNHVGITSDYSIGECYLDDDETRFISYIEFNKVKKKSGKILLMTHGYLGNKIGFFKMYKQLMEHYYIISFDLMGQGLSSSEDTLQLNSTQKWIEYFVRDINCFVEKMELEKFDLIGHSLGAYILTHYAEAHPKKVNKICLLSPGGVNRENAQFRKKFKEFIGNQGWGTKYILDLLYKKIFEKKISPLSLFCIPKTIRKWIAEIVYRGKRLRLDEKEKNLFVDLYKPIYAHKGSSNRCVGYLFNYGPMSTRPIMDVFKKLNESKSIHLFYGDFDWMDFQKTQKTIENENLSVTVQHVSNSEHQILFQNPYEATDLILQRLLK